LDGGGIGLDWNPFACGLLLELFRFAGVAACQLCLELDEDVTPPGTRLFHVTRDSPNLLVPWYLMSIYSYYHLDESLLGDDAYDMLCVRLDVLWDTIEHPHKHLVDRSALGAGTGFQIPESHYPEITKSAAKRIIRGG
jgi:hypothetical protein